MSDSCCFASARSDCITHFASMAERTVIAGCAAINLHISKERGLAVACIIATSSSVKSIPAFTRARRIRFTVLHAAISVVNIQHRGEVIYPRMPIDELLLLLFFGLRLRWVILFFLLGLLVV